MGVADLKIILLCTGKSGNLKGIYGAEFRLFFCEVKEMIIRSIKVLAAVMGISLFFWGCTSSSGFKLRGYNFNSICNVAIVDVGGKVCDENTKNLIADQFALELLKKGYSPVLRSQSLARLEKSGFDVCELSVGGGYAKAAQILEVPAIMVVNVPEYGKTITVNAQIISGNTGSVIWMGSGEGEILAMSNIVPIGNYKCSSESEKVKKSKEIVRKIAQNIPKRCN